VGDAQFQKKCLGKMEDVAEKEGRTVLFVSHNITAVELFCNCAIYIKAGNIRSSGIVREQINCYLNASNSLFTSLSASNNFHISHFKLSNESISDRGILELDWNLVY
jgi:lipopolysaccharide transport system ATP-binding protein